MIIITSYRHSHYIFNMLLISVYLSDIFVETLSPERDN